MPTPFQTEAWVEYGLGSAVLFLRYFARWRTVGWKGMQGDDYFAFAALVFWTAELVMLELIGQNGTNIGVTDEMGAKMTDAQKAKLEFGSKCLLAGWNFYVTLIFCLKGVMLCFYSRMTDIEGINTSTIWAIRETFVGIIAVNAAAIKPLFSASRWLISSKGSSRDKGTSSYINKYGHPLGTIGGSGIAAGLSSSRHQKMMTKLDDNSSEEHIVQKTDFGGYKHDIRAGSTTSGQSSSTGPDGIVVTRTYEVTPGKSTLDV
ncbi:hypothetical protein ACHAPT_000977 [Fusarium lateritium]